MSKAISPIHSFPSTVCASTPCAVDPMEPNEEATPEKLHGRRVGRRERLSVRAQSFLSRASDVLKYDSYDMPHQVCEKAPFPENDATRVTFYRLKKYYWTNDLIMFLIHFSICNKFQMFMSTVIRLNFFYYLSVSIVCHLVTTSAAIVSPPPRRSLQ